MYPSRGFILAIVILLRCQGNYSSAVTCHRPTCSLQMMIFGVSSRSRGHHWVIGDRETSFFSLTFAYNECHVEIGTVRYSWRFLLVKCFNWTFNVSSTGQGRVIPCFLGVDNWSPALFDICCFDSVLHYALRLNWSNNVFWIHLNRIIIL